MFFASLQHFGDPLEFFVLQKLCNQLRPWIFGDFSTSFFRHCPRQQHLGFDLQQSGRQHHKLR